jgi:cellulose synthase/poly-beta-1,6-N-acetylglucosamine synthase-like glycosyltransferase
MASLPFFVISPTNVLSIIGLIRGPKPVRLPDPIAATELAIDVVIPAHNESATIALCLGSLMRQTVKPHSVIVVDDGSDDDTADIAEAFAAANDYAIRVIRRRRSIGKTPGLKIGSRTSEGDVLFILDGDTVLVSDDYIEKVVAQLYRVPGIASASGAVYPLRDCDREELSRLDTVQRLIERRPQTTLIPVRPFLNRIAKAISNFYRETLYHFIQNFVNGGAQSLFGSTMNPIGCAIAYRRDYLRDQLFDHYEPTLGENMTSSEDIFFGAAFVAYGYHNTQVLDVIARSDEPEVHRIPRQLLMWSSAWLQTAYYLPEVFVSPFRTVRRWKRRRESAKFAEQRRVVDGYREPFGLHSARQLGRPAGWMVFFAIFEKISYPLILVILLAIGAWEPLLITLGAEVLLYVILLAAYSKENRLMNVVKGVAATPLRYLAIVFDIVTIGKFLFDLVTKRGRWQK